MAVAQRVSRPPQNGADVSTQETKNPPTPTPAPRAATGLSGIGERVGLSSVTGAFRQISAPPQRGPALRRLAGLSGWAAVLGLVGLTVGARGLVAILVGGIPRWYEPTMIGLGLFGIVLTSAAFLTARRGPLPWAFLGAASCVLLASIVVTGSL
jgi:hypothetical protein